MREAATDKRITPLLSTPGAVTLEQRNTAKKGKTLIFPPWYARAVGAGERCYMTSSARGKDVCSTPSLNPEMWPCGPVEPSCDLLPETADGWTWLLAWSLRLSMVSTKRDFFFFLLHDQIKHRKSASWGQMVKTSVLCGRLDVLVAIIKTSRRHNIYLKRYYVDNTHVSMRVFLTNRWLLPPEVY